MRGIEAGNPTLALKASGVDWRDAPDRRSCFGILKLSPNRVVELGVQVEIRAGAVAYRSTRYYKTA